MKLVPGKWVWVSDADEKAFYRWVQRPAEAVARMACQIQTLCEIERLFKDGCQWTRMDKPDPRKRHDR